MHIGLAGTISFSQLGTKPAALNQGSYTCNDLQALARHTVIGHLQKMIVDLLHSVNSVKLLICH